MSNITKHNPAKKGNLTIFERSEFNKIQFATTRQKEIVIEFMQDKAMQDISIKSPNTMIAIANIGYSFEIPDGEIDYNNNPDTELGITNEVFEMIKKSQKGIRVGMLKKVHPNTLRIICDNLTSEIVRRVTTKDKETLSVDTLFFLLGQKYKTIRELILIIQLGKMGKFGNYQVFGNFTIADVQHWFNSYNSLFGAYRLKIERMKSQSTNSETNPSTNSETNPEMKVKVEAKMKEIQNGILNKN